MRDTPARSGRRRSRKPLNFPREALSTKYCICGVLKPNSEFYPQHTQEELNAALRPPRALSDSYGERGRWRATGRLGPHAPEVARPDVTYADRRSRPWDRSPISEPAMERGSGASSCFKSGDPSEAGVHQQGGCDAGRIQIAKGEGVHKATSSTLLYGSSKPEASHGGRKNCVCVLGDVETN